MKTKNSRSSGTAPKSKKVSIDLLNEDGTRWKTVRLSEPLWFAFEQHAASIGKSTGDLLSASILKQARRYLSSCDTGKKRKPKALERLIRAVAVA